MRGRLLYKPKPNNYTESYTVDMDLEKFFDRM